VTRFGIISRRLVAGTAAYFSADAFLQWSYCAAQSAPSHGIEKTPGLVSRRPVGGNGGRLFRRVRFSGV